MKRQAGRNKQTIPILKVHAIIHHQDAGVCCFPLRGDEYVKK
jgi:hypothetical protein